MSRLGGIYKLERLDAVLEDIRPGEEAAFLRDDVANVLDGSIIGMAIEDFGEPVVLVLRVANVVSVLHVGLLSESQTTRSDVDAVIIIQR